MTINSSWIGRQRTKASSYVTSMIHFIISWYAIEMEMQSVGPNLGQPFILLLIRQKKKSSSLG